MCEIRRPHTAGGRPTRTRTNSTGAHWRWTRTMRFRHSGEALLYLIAVVAVLIHQSSTGEAADADADAAPLATGQLQAGPERTNVSTGSRLVSGFLSSLSVIVVSELGDKTFFIAAILAMKYSKLTVFAGCTTALVLMTLLSVCLGYAANAVPPVYTHWISTVLFALFGVKMLYDAYQISESDSMMEEYREVEKTLLNNKGKRLDLCCKQTFLNGVYWQAVTMTFLAEWGDRSQISTVILAARENTCMVMLGAIVGHSLCCLVAVLAGGIVAQRISTKTVTLIGGLTFLACAACSVIAGYDDSVPLQR